MFIVLFFSEWKKKIWVHKNRFFFGCGKQIQKNLKFDGPNPKPGHASSKKRAQKRHKNHQISLPKASHIRNKFTKHMVAVTFQVFFPFDSKYSTLYLNLTILN
jgi:hypothetical protein